jgi:DNA (cytosine-5)-methyltransferase 1
VNAKPRLLDLYCGAGGAGVGYARAGFDVFGVDIAPQPSYPFEFLQWDARLFLQSHAFEVFRFDAIHASPPCQTHVRGLAAVNDALGRTNDHRDLIGETRELLRATGLPYVIENVRGAPLEDPVQLCGSSFELDVRRHRLFECSFPLLVPPCAHYAQREQKFWNGDRSVRNADGSRSYTGHGRLSSVVQVYGHTGEQHLWGPAMGIDWTDDPDELREMIPPAYTEFIGAALLVELGAVVG